MRIDLEEQLRQAYAQLPNEGTDPTDMVARSRRTAARFRRRRTAGACAGTVAAALAIGAIAVGGPILTSPGRDVGILPAGGATSTPTFATHNPATTRIARHPLPQEGTDKPLAGLSGRLLPHGSQLPTGIAYHGVSTFDGTKTWTTSVADGSNAATTPVPVLIAAKQNLNGTTPAQTRALYGMTATVFDMASTSGPDTSPAFRSVSTNILRFRTPAFAKSAIAKAQRKEGGLYWVKPTMTTPNVSWSGVPGVSGAHGVYDCAGWGPTPIYVAYQVVDNYIVSTNAETPALAEQAVTDTVGNLQTAGLLK